MRSAVALLPVVFAGVLALAACRDDPAGVSDEASANGTTSAADVDVQDEAPLLRIARAERETVFSGWKTATSGPEGGRQTRMKVTRLADGRTFMAWEQEGRRDMRWVYRSRHRWIDDPTLLASNYEVVEVESDDSTLAWREARTFEVRARQPGRPSMTLYVDAEHWLVLGEEIRDFEGVQRFEWHFETIEFAPDESPGDWPEGAGVTVDDAGDPSTEPAAGSLQPERLPEGFELVDRKVWDDDGVAEYYSDGLAALVVRQRPAPDSGPESGVDSEGELTRRSCSGRSEVSGTFDGIEISILGNVPLDQLEALAATLRVGP